MMVDRQYCMSSYLMLRTMYPHGKSFDEKYPSVIFSENTDREPVQSSVELEEKLRQQVESACKNGKVAIALSGGIDSAILAKFLPKGSMAYTFRCVVPGVKVVDETSTAAKYAKECGLSHKVIEIYWEDMEQYAEPLMKRKGAPLHSIEIQIYKAALQAKKDGFDTLIFGESADVNFGGFDGLLSKDYLVYEFVERFSNLLPYKALKEPVMIMEPFLKYSKNGYIDVHEFVRHQFYCESMGSYTNAMALAGISFCAPFSKTYLAAPIDYERVRNGENKYLVREIFNRLYAGFEIPAKIPMPRPMNEWLKDWEGPKREEFIPNCHLKMSGDQKWQLWCLERFLNMLEK